jgi:choline dehydrogenase-like flavoprotein
MKAIVVGSGAGGATAARELAAQGWSVLVLEAGPDFRPLARGVLKLADPLRRAGLLGGTRIIPWVFPPMRAQRASEDLVLLRGVAAGGSTVVACGNIVRAENGLAEIGLNLRAEFVELEGLLGAQPFPRQRWRPVTRRMFEAAEVLGIDPQPTPKAIDARRCVACGLCEVGCATGARWDSRRFLADATAGGAGVRLRAPVTRVVVEDGRVRGVLLGRRRHFERIDADAVVLAAGGIGTAQILRASGLPARDTLWVDIVLTVGGRLEGARQLCEPPMVWYCKQDGYILSPYPDILSHWFHRPWRRVTSEDRVGLMIKLADTPQGEVAADGTVRKALTAADRGRLAEAEAIAREVMERAGVRGPLTRSMLCGGHLGGTVPLTRADVPAMRPSGLPPGLWVADLSLLPRSQGLPTILTTAALALKVARRIAGSCG